MWKKRRREYMMKSAVSTEVNVQKSMNLMSDVKKKKSMNLMLDVKEKKYKFNVRCYEKKV
jgi:hypothetical protein